VTTLYRAPVIDGIMVLVKKYRAESNLHGLEVAN
jgi:hypothetical protein